MPSEMPDQVWINPAKGGALSVSTVPGRAPFFGTEYVRADASPLPPPGSAAEAEMVERVARAISDVDGMPSDPRLARAILRAAFAKGGESDGEGRSG